MSREAERTGFKRKEEELVGIEQWLEMNKCSIKNGEGLTMQTSHLLDAPSINEHCCEQDGTKAAINSWMLVSIC